MRSTSAYTSPASPRELGTLKRVASPRYTQRPRHGDTEPAVGTPDVGGHLTETDRTRVAASRSRATDCSESRRRGSAPPRSARTATSWGPDDSARRARAQPFASAPCPEDPPPHRREDSGPRRYAGAAGADRLAGVTPNPAPITAPTATCAARAHFPGASVHPRCAPSTRRWATPSHGACSRTS